MYWFLVAFHVPASVVDAALALSAQSAATLLPLTPGGLGTQQALLGYMFRNARRRPAACSRSASACRSSITLTNVDRRRARDLADAAPAAVAGPARRAQARDRR